MNIDHQHDIFDYRTPFILSSLRDSEHKSKRQGSGSDFYKKSLFLAEPNPARIDLNRSVTDPFESLYVRSYRQRSKLDVITLVDGSDSMRFAEKPELVTACEHSITRSVAARNDNYQSFLLSDKIKVNNNSELIKTHFVAQKNSHNHDVAQAFDIVDRLLPDRRALIFIISDFHWSTEKLNQTFNALSGHYLIPIVVWLSAEYQDFPAWRFVQIRDAETGRSRLIFVTKKQKQQIEYTFTDRKIQLNSVFQQFNSRACWMSDHFSVQQMSEYFHNVTK
ncbi:MAG: hypothetical protein COA83_03910 [Methylophaga sp.]|nr:MAG: hypothetical protein COA83_03910 [Methylophaga sp.]